MNRPVTLGVGTPWTTGPMTLGVGDPVESGYGVCHPGRPREEGRSGRGTWDRGFPVEETYGDYDTQSK